MKKRMKIGIISLIGVLFLIGFNSGINDTTGYVFSYKMWKLPETYANSDYHMVLGVNATTVDSFINSYNFPFQYEGEGTFNPEIVWGYSASLYTFYFTSTQVYGNYSLNNQSIDIKVSAFWLSGIYYYIKHQVNITYNASGYTVLLQSYSGSGSESTWTKLQEKVFEYYDETLIVKSIEFDVESIMGSGFNTNVKVVVNNNETHPLSEIETYIIWIGNAFTSNYKIYYKLIDFHSIDDLFLIAKMRSLFWESGDNSISQYDWVDIPYIFGTESILWESKPLPPTESPVGTNDSYWTYITFEIIVESTDFIVIGDATINWTIGINITNTREIIGYYPYSTIVNQANMNIDEWGDWGIFNFAKVAFAYILAFLWFLVECIGFFITLIGATVLWYLILQLVTIVIWNILVYWLYIGINWVGFGVLMVFINLPQILAWVIAAIVAGLIYAFSFGTLDFAEIFNNVNNFVLIIVNFIVEYVLVFFAHFDTILLFIVGYLTLIALLYLKILYCKGRGFTNRAKKLQDSLGSYMKPVKLTLSVISKLKEVVMPTTSGDESEK